MVWPLISTDSDPPPIDTRTYRLSVQALRRAKRPGYVRRHPSESGAGVADLVRRDIWVLEEESGPWHPITEAYARAVGVMQARQPDEPTSWAYQAAVHGAPPGRPRGQFVDQCQHNTWFFLSWHRMRSEERRVGEEERSR